MTSKSLDTLKITTIFLASGNEHKVEELSQFLAELHCTGSSANVIGGMPSVVEDGETFEANARKKAHALHALLTAPGYVLADDSGLEVDALDGRPGIFSARYAGAEASDRQNIEKLLEELKGVAIADRTARFRCVLYLISPDGSERSFNGVCEGSIANQIEGNHGFGYDPVFIPFGHERTFGSLPESVKADSSHRFDAVRKLRCELQALLSSSSDT